MQITAEQDNDEVKKTTIRLSDEEWAEFRKRAIDERLAAQDLLARIVREYLDSKHKRGKA